jgi:class 3 adenylate cyclase
VHAAFAVHALQRDSDTASSLHRALQTYDNNNRVDGGVTSAARRLARQRRETDGVLQASLPHPGLAAALAAAPAGLLSCPSASVVHVEMQSILALQGLVTPADLYTFLGKIVSILDSVAAEFGAFRARAVGHTYTVVFGVPLSTTAPTTTAATAASTTTAAAAALPRPAHTAPTAAVASCAPDPLAHVRDALGLVQLVQREVAQFNAKHRLGLALSMGVAHGPLAAGLVGGSSGGYGFDVAGIQCHDVCSRAAAEHVLRDANVNVQLSQ